MHIWSQSIVLLNFLLSFPVFWDPRSFWIFIRNLILILCQFKQLLRTTNQYHHFPYFSTSCQKFHILHQQIYYPSQLDNQGNQMHVSPWVFNVVHIMHYQYTLSFQERPSIQCNYCSSSPMMDYIPQTLSPNHPFLPSLVLFLSVDLSQ